MTIEAMYYEKRADGAVRCLLCPHHCLIASGNCGRCRVRRNENGKLRSLIYGLCAASALDPIEKKPLHRFMPGSTIYSLGNVGCNFSCSFCQNYVLSQETPQCFALSPAEAVQNAEILKERGNIGIAFTYAEPTVWYEYVYHTSQLLYEHDMKAILVSNGFIEQEPLKELLPAVAALNIDVKAYNDAFYRELCGGGEGALAVVKSTVETALAMGCHVEVTTLVIPGRNDDVQEIDKLARWLAGLCKDVPLHLSRYFPRYRLNTPMTEVETLYRLRDIAAKHLRYVYLGNV